MNLKAVGAVVTLMAGAALNESGNGDLADNQLPPRDPAPSRGLVCDVESYLLQQQKDFGSLLELGRDIQGMGGEIGAAREHAARTKGKSAAELERQSVFQQDLARTEAGVQTESSRVAAQRGQIAAIGKQVRELSQCNDANEGALGRLDGVVEDAQHKVLAAQLAKAERELRQELSWLPEQVQEFYVAKWYLKIGLFAGAQSVHSDAQRLSEELLATVAKARPGSPDESWIKKAGVDTEGWIKDELAGKHGFHVDPNRDGPQIKPEGPRPECPRWTGMLWPIGAEIAKSLAPGKIGNVGVEPLQGDDLDGWQKADENNQELQALRLLYQDCVEERDQQRNQERTGGGEGSNVRPGHDGGVLHDAPDSDRGDASRTA